MPALSAIIDSRLAQLPQQLALEWPGGRIGAATAAVRLKLRHRRSLAWLMHGSIGTLAAAYLH